MGLDIVGILILLLLLQCVLLLLDHCMLLLYRLLLCKELLLLHVWLGQGVTDEGSRLKAGTRGG